MVKPPSPVQDMVARALASEPGGLTLNELHDRCAGARNGVSRALMALEVQGRARYEFGRWHACEPGDASPVLRTGT